MLLLLLLATVIATASCSLVVPVLRHVSVEMVASSSSSSVVVRSLLVVLHEPLVASAVLSQSELTLTGVRSALSSPTVEPRRRSTAVPPPPLGPCGSSGSSSTPTPPGTCPAIPAADGWPKRANIHPTSC
uniref:Putative dual specificity testis-specific protein kinase 1 n=1 Tax=Anopheles darlingi TaxID=43151 RepID=A0A2M4DJR1_ANODA